MARARGMAAGVLASAVLLCEVAAAGQVLPFQVFGGEEGIPQSQVTCLEQDAPGFLWVGTWGGLARYDGRRFRGYFVRDGLPSNRVAEVLCSRDGTLWAATAAGLGRLEGDRFATVEGPGLSGVRCRALCEDGAGRLWVGTDKGVFRIEGGKALRPPGLEKAVARVHDLLALEGAVWAVTEEGLFDVGGGVPVPVPAPPVPARSLRCVESGADGIWLGTQGQGLWRRRAGRWEEVPGFREWSFWRLRRGRSGTLYAASTDRGLAVFRPGATEPEIWAREEGLPSEVINDAFEDREGTLWVATDIGGLARLSGRAAVRFGREPQFPDPCIFGISPSSAAGEFWAGTLRGAVRFRPLPRLEVKEVLTAGHGLPSGLVWKVLEEPGGNVWLLTDRGLRLRPRAGDAPRNPPGIPLDADTVNDILLDGEGRLWISADDRRGGLSVRLADGTWRRWNRTAEGEPLTYGRTLARRRAGGVYLSHAGGIAVSDGSLLSSLPGRPPLPGYASALLEDSRGNLWAGNDSGLARRALDGRWTVVETVTGLGSPPVYCLAEDARGAVWVGTARGVFLLPEDGSVRHLTAGDGLAGLETNMNGLLADPGGAVWVGGVAGLTRVDPGLFRTNSIPPRLVVEEAALEDGTVLSLPRSLRLRWPARGAAFRISVLSFRNPERCSYRARMEGVDREWTPPRPAGELRYTLLPPGRRTLYLQAVNDSGVTGEVLEVPVEVIPPFWRRGGFFWTLAILAALTLLGAYRWRIRILHRRREELERLVGERTRELAEANRSLERMATFETMTGLFNRRAILQKLRESLPPKGEKGRRFGLILLDLDNFKSVNDTLGHAAGDQVLSVFAQRIQGTLREGDLMGRFGGDEFLLILPGADLASVQAVGQRIAHLAETFTGRGGSVRVSVSAGGLAVQGTEGREEQELLARADALLYEVKRAGGRGFRAEEVP